MRSVKSLVEGWKTAGTGVAVLIVLQAFGLRAGWPQEPVQPRINEEFLEQEKIYHSRGADSRRVYTTDRGSRGTRSFFPPASATLSAGWAARTDGSISERAKDRPYWTTTHAKAPRRRLKSAAGSAPGRARSRCP